MKKNYKNIILVITMIAIIATGIIFKQPFICMLPLLISLFVGLFQAEANRYSYIAGGLNAILYSYVYFRLELYGSAASALFFSSPIQILTFFNWNRNSYKKSTHFKKLSNKARVGIGLGFVIVWLCVMNLLKLTGTAYSILDSTVTLFGMLVSILTMLAYVEYSYLWIISSAFALLLNIQVAMDNISQITYVIYACYGMWCVVNAFMNVQKLYKIQQNKE